MSHDPIAEAHGHRLAVVRRDDLARLRIADAKIDYDSVACPKGNGCGPRADASLSLEALAVRA
jgi:hypothetical protein